MGVEFAPTYKDAAKLRPATKLDARIRIRLRARLSLNKLIAPTKKFCYRRAISLKPILPLFGKCGAAYSRQKRFAGNRNLRATENL